MSAIGVVLLTTSAAAGLVARPRQSVGTAQAVFDEATASLGRAQAHEAAAQAESDRIVADRGRLSAAQVELAGRLDGARRRAKAMAVAAYVSGGPGSAPSALLSSDDLGDLLWHNQLVQSGLEHHVDEAQRYRELLARADDQVRALVDRVAAYERDRDLAASEVFWASVVLHGAEQKLTWARLGADSGGDPAADAPGLTDGWARLRQCESSGNYRAVSPDGRYRGAYQFDLQTWQTMGGTGDPIDAPPEEQDARAKALYAKRSAAPWPVCGRYLRTA